MNVSDLTKIERRLLAYLDQKGAMERRQIVIDLAAPDTRAGKGLQNGSNGAAPLIVGRWAKRLIEAGWVKINRSASYTNGRGKFTGGFYQSHQITPEGRAALRESNDERS